MLGLIKRIVDVICISEIAVPCAGSANPIGEMFAKMIDRKMSFQLKKVFGFSQLIRQIEMLRFG
jgi:hypothetical protein